MVCQNGIEQVTDNKNDTYWMKHALSLAEQAAESGEVPVGAVLVSDNKIIAEGWNQPIGLHDPTAHAEVVTLRKAGLALANYRLPGTTLYVTLEPCAMCASAMIHARIERLVYGAKDPRAGVAESVTSLYAEPWHNHQVVIEGGVLAEPCGQILKDFFKQRR